MAKFLLPRGPAAWRIMLRTPEGFRGRESAGTRPKRPAKSPVILNEYECRTQDVLDSLRVPEHTPGPFEGIEGFGAAP